MADARLVVPASGGRYRVPFLQEDARISYPGKFTVEDPLPLARVMARLNGAERAAPHPQSLRTGESGDPSYRDSGSLAGYEVALRASADSRMRIRPAMTTFPMASFCPSRNLLK
jgi:hypothetical protein